MWMLLLGLVLGALSGARDSVAGEFCRCTQQNFAWRGCDAQGVCDPAGWQGCSPSPDDSYTIFDGCHVTVDAGTDLLLSQVGVNRTTIQAGGSLVVRGPGELRLGPIGLTAEAGSSIDIGGCYRTTDASGCAPSLGPSSIFSIGLVTPCRDGDCADDAEVVRIVWNASTSAPVLSQIDALLAQIQADRDVLCFWQDVVTGQIGADAGYCYKIVSVGRSGEDRTLDFDVRQTWSTQSDQAGYPLRRRVEEPVTLADDAPIGTRRLRFQQTDVVVGRTEPVGRWLRCNGGQRAYLIASGTDAAGGDTLLLADGRGVAVSYAAGSTCFLDWGWGIGDLAFVMAPVHVSSATSQPGDAYLRLLGDTTLRAIVADGLGGDTDGGRTAIEIRGGPLRAFEHVWVTDPLVKDRAAVLLDDLPCGATVDHLTVTGGPPDPVDDRNYGLAWYGGASCAYSVRHLYTRFMGDDNFVLESSGADPVAAISLQYVEAGPASLPGDSGQLFDFGEPNPTVVSAADVLCTGCTSDDGFGSLLLVPAGPGEMRDFVWVGTHNGGVLPDSPTANNPNFSLQRFAVIGSNVDPANPVGSGPLVGINADSFYVRDVYDPRIGSNQLCTANPYGAQTRSVTHGVFYDVDLGGTPCEVSQAQMSDVYFIDVTRSANPGPILLVEPWASNAVLANLTMAFQGTPKGVTSGVSAPFSAAAPQLTLSGLLLTGFRGPDVERAMSLGSPLNPPAMHWGAPACFYDNAQDDAPWTLAAYPVAPVRGVDPRFINPASGRYDLAGGSVVAAAGCGARDAGVGKANWAHKKAKLEPINSGPRFSTSCGIGAELAPLLALLAAGMHRASAHARRPL